MKMTRSESDEKNKYFWKNKYVMKTASIRQQLHNYLEIADDKKVKAIYIMMEEEIKENTVEYTDQFKAVLDKRYGDYKTGKLKLISPGDSKKKIQAILKGKAGGV